MEPDRSCELVVWVFAGSSRNTMLRAADGTIKVWVNAAPVKGAANEAVRVLLAKHLGVAKSAVQVVKGFRGRAKVVSIAGVLLPDALDLIKREEQ